ncbi:LamG-like jellyroll fold domain-containing protein [Aquabacterium sp. OR-4]|uniref:LamG-like jellyroll fold domain-containing protein n=1 Tax=Aquabacterium sp. OR-4 TaxID=2978127 RepID=UPI0028C7E00E|nr:LamG-like jellyroll fold domain-containing protein [Aquabacterium sp. OR-4]MDT7836369.1 LamG-like jellyroll fold domain-containing protein [Aquabacterium sp. OR-4]
MKIHSLRAAVALTAVLTTALSPLAVLAQTKYEFKKLKPGLVVGATTAAQPPAEPANPAFSLSATSLDFGDVTLGSTGERSVLVSNSGNVALTTLEITAPASAFTAATNCPTTLPTGADCAVTVAFTPTSGIAYSGASLEVKYGSLALQRVALAGRGVLSVDPNFSQTSLLLRGEGTADSTAVVDSSMPQKKVTVSSAGASINTSVVKMGSGSIYFDGASGVLSVPADVSLNLGGSDWTAEFWMYPQGNFSKYRTILSRRPWGATPEASYEVGLEKGTGKLYFWTGGTVWTSPSAVSLNSWTHVAVAQSGSNVLLFLNGTLVRTVAATAHNRQDSHPLHIGAFYSSESQHYQGYLDDLRITKGLARYTSNFTVPTTPYSEGGGGIVQYSGYKAWADGSLASSCNDYRYPSTGSYQYTGATGDGVYRIRPLGQSATDVTCDMTADGGGWTMVVGVSVSNRNHANPAAVAWTGSGLTATGKVSDAFINAAKSGHPTGFRLTSGSVKSYFSTSCVFAANATATGNCLKYTTTYSPSPVWDTATQNSDGCSSPTYYLGLSSMKHAACSGGTQQAGNGGLVFSRAGNSTTNGLTVAVQGTYLFNQTGILWVR